MTEPFILQVTYQGTEYEYKARFERWGYTHRIAVLMGEVAVFFEPDEEGGYRALVTDQDKLPTAPNINLLQAIADRLVTLGALS